MRLPRPRAVWMGIALSIAVAFGIPALIAGNLSPATRAPARAASTASGAWHVQLPPGTAPWSYKAASCVKGTTTCWMSGGRFDNNAQVIKSTDGGKSWSSQSGALTAMGGSIGISCPTVSDCVVVGGRFLNSSQEPGVAVTTDGGTKWTMEPLPASVETSSVHALTAVSCATAQACVAVGNRRGTAQAVIVATTTGGTHWSAQTSPVTSQLQSVSCPDSTHCFAVGDGGAIIASTNGGATWTAQPPPTASSLWGISCPSANECIAVGDGGTIAETVDGGSTWTPRVSGTSSTLRAVSCPTTSNCVTVGDSGTVLFTTNGGLLWSAGTSNISEGLFAVACYTASGCVAGSTSSDSAPYSAALALRTTDGGSTWSDFSANTGAERLGWFASGGMSCPGPTTCFVTGASGPLTGGSGGGFVLRTTDGLQWSTIYRGAAGSGALHAISCGDLKHCVAVGWSHSKNRGVIFATSDGGATWKAQTPPAAYASKVIHSVSCPDASHCFITTATDQVFHTSDGGKTWTAQSESTSELFGISCPDPLHCVAVNGSAVEMTTDGGSTWTSATAPVTDLRGVDCHDDQHCVAVGEGAEIGVTTDGGATWTDHSFTVPSVGDWDLWDVSCVTVQVCMASGGTGTNVTNHPGFLLQTSDGGSTWKRVPTSGTHGLPAVGCTVVACWAGGARGAIVSDIVAHTLRVRKKGQGAGKVTSSPAGISCGMTCSARFVAGTKVALHAHAASGTKFAGWSGGGCSGTHRCTVTMSVDQTVKARFVPKPGKLQLIGSPRVKGEEVFLKLACSGRHRQSCHTKITLTTVEKRRHGKVVSLSASGSGHKVVVGQKSLVIRGGRKVKVAVKLNATGRALLQSFRKLPTTLTVYLVAAGKSKSVARRKVTFTLKPKPPRHKHHGHGFTG